MSRPTYVTQPCAAVTPIVIPPARVARHEITLPRLVTRSLTPLTATRAVVGVNVSFTRTAAFRRTTTARPEAAIGAPQREPQHQLETASGTRRAPV
jgi:hypothetical protein